MSRIARKSGTSAGNNAVANSQKQRNILPYVAREAEESEEQILGLLPVGEPEQKARTGGSTSGGHVAETTVPNFLLKLWRLVEDKNYDFCISWDETGSSFHVWEPYAFSKDVLPLYFKHSNLNSFIRQLNMYGFRKVTNLEQGALKNQSSEMDSLEFHHQYFMRGHPELLEFIKRKGTSTKLASTEVVDVKQRDAGIRTLNQALEEIRQLREKQGGMDARLTQVKRENQTLWSEIACMRQMHMKQQQVVNKLVRFLMTLVQPAGEARLGKRKILAIGSGLFNNTDDSLGSAQKRARLESSESATDRESLDIIESLKQELQSHPHMATSALQQLSSGALPHLINVSSGPTIADVTDEFEPTSGDPTGILHAEGALATGYAAPPVSQQSGKSAMGAEVQRPMSQISAQQAYPLQQSLVTPVNSGMLSQQQRVRADQHEALRTSPESGGPTIAFSDVQPTGAGGGDLALTAPGNHGNNLSPQWTKPDFTDYLDCVEADLDTLKDFLVAEGIEGDTTLLDDLLSSSGDAETNPDNSRRSIPTGQGDIVGNEVQIYKPPEFLLDFGTGSNYSIAPLAPPFPATANAGGLRPLPTTATSAATSSGINQTFFPTPTAPVHQHQQQPLINSPSNDFFSTDAVVQPFFQSQLNTPATSPSTSIRQPTDQVVQLRRENGQSTGTMLQDWLVQNQPEGSIAAGESPKASLFESKSGKRR